MAENILLIGEHNKNNCVWCKTGDFWNIKLNLKLLKPGKIELVRVMKS